MKVDVDPVATAQQGVTSDGVFMMPASDLTRCIGADEHDWARFASHWDDLAPDSYAAELGTQRLRRYGHFAFTPSDGTATLMPHSEFVQPENSNPLYVGRNRHFEALTDSFARDPLLGHLLAILARVATALDELAEWSAKVTPFRVIASADGQGEPTPEGLHRDGVILASSLLIDRHNAIGGTSAIHDLDGRQLLTTTLCQRGSLLLGDDRRTLHGVSAIRPANPDEPAQRDVLVITFAPSTPPGRPPPS
jgi:hypothetical protein